MRTKIVYGVIAAVILILVLFFGFINHYYGKMNINTGDDAVQQDSSQNDSIKADMDDFIKKADEVTVSKLDRVIAELEAYKSEIHFNDDVFNILLIGNDSRDEDTDRGRSDSMILVSINRKDKSIHMTSFMRDIYTNISGHGNNRLNAAYAFGGAELLEETLENSFKIRIDRYVKVGFDAFMDIIDFCNGIDGIEMSDEEFINMNNNIREINIVNNINPNKGIHKGKKNKDGTYSLTGKQALAYSRIRYAANGDEKNDFGRTLRQRTVLLKLTEKVKHLNVMELNSLMEKILPQITTNLQKGELITLLLNFMDYKNYSMHSQRIPIDGSYEPLTVGKMAVLGIDFSDNIEFLKESIYGVKPESGQDTETHTDIEE